LFLNPRRSVNIINHHDLAHEMTDSFLIGALLFVISSLSPCRLMSVSKPPGVERFSG
jgi:hypothetical protein